MTISHRQAGLWASDYQGTIVQDSETASKTPLLIKLNSSPNVWLKVTYYVGPTIRNYFYHSAGWTSVTVGKHIKSLTALACPKAVACVALIFILECCASGCGTQNPLFPNRTLLHYCNQTHCHSCWNLCLLKA